MSKLKERGYQWRTLKDMYEKTPDIRATEMVREMYPAYVGTWCKYLVVTTEATMLNDHVILSHGPLGCATSTRNFFSTHFSMDQGNPFSHMPSTNMGAAEVVMGGEQALDDAIRAVDRDYKPSLIVVLSNCCAGLIGDDIPGVIDMVQNEVKAKILYIPSDGFDCNVGGRAIEITMPLWADIMDTPKKIDKEAVNILGIIKETMCEHGQRKIKHKFPTNGHELMRYVEGMGLKVHRFLLSGDYDYMRTAPEAGLNAFDCLTWGIPLAFAMKEKFGTPHTRQCVPMGVEATNKWIREIAEFTGRQKEAERLIKKEYAEVEEIWEKGKEAVKGKVLVFDNGRNTQIATARTLSIIRMCMDLGVDKAYILNQHPMEMKARWHDVEYFLKEGINPMVLDAPYPYQDPINLPDAVEDLGLDKDQIIHFIADVYPYGKAGVMDPSNEARIDSAIHHRKTGRYSPPRGIGYRGIHGWIRDIIASIKASERRCKPTLYARVMGGQSLECV